MNTMLAVAGQYSPDYMMPGAAPYEDPYESLKNGTLMPRCHTGDLMLLMMERYVRADGALAIWAEVAKKCVEFVEGKQWSADELAKAADDDRPTLTLNKIAPLMRLVQGYFANNRLDNRVLPTDDANSTEAVAEVLSKILKQIALNTKEKYVSTEVTLDGLFSGRGYYDWRLDFERNDFGEIRGIAKDPFTIRPDADGDTYEPAGWNHVFESRWWSIDEVEYTLGKNVSALVEPLMGGHSYRGGIGTDMRDLLSENTPWRTFGGSAPDSLVTGYQQYIANVIDAYRKSVLVIDCQHYIRTMQRSIIDLDSGDRYPIPDNQTPQMVAKAMQWMIEQYAMRGKACPMRIEYRPAKRVRWTTMIGDIIVYDKWSKYRSPTIVPYFPYFRRGKTRGAVEDLLDPQREINKRRSSQVDILTRIAHSGWIWHTDSLDEEEKQKLEQFGAAAGINLQWKGPPTGKPERLTPGQMPTGIEKLEEKATADLKEIAGINDSALGQLDRVQSGRAIEARTKQSILGIEPYMDNSRRTAQLCGEKKVEMIQDFYTEPRLFRIQGESGGYSSIGINIPTAIGEIDNNVTLGRYGVTIDEVPMSATYLSAQSEELMEMVEKGILPVQMVQDIAVDLSTVPQKTLIKMRLAAFLKAQGLPTAEELVAMQQAGVPLNPGMIAPLLPAPSGGAQPAAAGAPQEAAGMMGAKPPAQSVLPGGGG